MEKNNFIELNAKRRLNKVSVSGLNIKYNYDANIGKVNTVFVSKRLIKSNKLQTSKLHKFEKDIRYNEQISKELVEHFKECSHLNDDGLSNKGQYLMGGDVVVGVVRAKPIPETVEERLLRSIGIEFAWNDISLCVPQNVEGVVLDINVKKSSKKNIDKEIEVLFEEKYPLELGDVLESEYGVKAIVVGVIDDTDIDIIANNPDFKGIITRDVALSAKGNLQARSTGPYSFFKDYPLGSCFFNNPQKITINDIKKFTNENLFSKLQNIICYTKKDNRVMVYDSLVNGYIISNNICNEYLLKNLYFLITALGGKLNFAINNINYIINDEDLNLKIKPLTSEIITKNSFGQVLNSETLDCKSLLPLNGGLFCERIFGPLKDYECRCGKYKRINKEGVVCEKCGVEVNSSRVRTERIGHINSIVDYPNPLYPKEKLDKIVVIPPAFRDVLITDKIYYFTSINNHYRGIINRIKYNELFLKSESDSFILDINKKFLVSSINGLFDGGDGKDKYCGIFSEIYDIVRDSFIDVPVDYSAKCHVLPNNEISNYNCKIPYAIVKELFKPYIMRVLVDKGIAKNIKNAKKMIECDHRNNCSLEKLIESIFEKELDLKVFLISSSEDSKILTLKPLICNENVLYVSYENYKKLNILNNYSVKIFINNEKIENCLNNGFTKIENDKKHAFFKFLEEMKKDDFSREQKKEKVMSWIKQIGNNSFVNSLAFCFLSGRRVVRCEQEEKITSRNNVNFDSTEEDDLLYSFDNDTSWGDLGDLDLDNLNNVDIDDFDDL